MVFFLATVVGVVIENAVYFIVIRVAINFGGRSNAYRTIFNVALP